MLEKTWSWGEWEMEGVRRAQRNGRVKGRTIGRIEVLKSFWRKEKQYQKLLIQGKEIPNLLMEIHECYVRMLESEGTSELLKFIQKYPNRSNEQLAERVLKESEYWR